MIRVFNKGWRGKAALSIALAVAAAAFSLNGLGCGGQGYEGDALRVAATILPLADFCRNVGGDMVEVKVLVPPGASPHTYELTSEQMKFLYEADVLVENGLELTPWLDETLEKVDNSEMITVVAGDAVGEGDLIPALDGSELEGENGIYDPHVWLDPELAVHIVEAIGESFAEADPEHAEEYRRNAAAYVGELEELDAYIEEATEDFSKRKFVSFHPAWTYFARRYGLKQVGVVEELPGREPGAGEIASLVDLIREEGVEVIFTEPQFDPKAAEAIADESGAQVMLKVLDPVGDPGDARKDTYIELMKYNVEVMGEAMI